MRISTILAVNGNPDYSNPMCVTGFLTPVPSVSEKVQRRVEVGDPTLKSHQAGFMPKLTFVCFVFLATAKHHDCWIR